MGAVHDFNDFPVDISRQDTLFFPEFVTGFRRPLGKKKFTFGFAPLIERFFADLYCNFIGVPIKLLTIDLHRCVDSQH